MIAGASGGVGLRSHAQEMTDHGTIGLAVDGRVKGMGRSEYYRGCFTDEHVMDWQ